MIELARLRPGQGFSVGKFFGYYSLRLVPFIAIRRFIARILSRYLNRSRRKPADLPPIAEHLFQTVVERGVSMAPPVADLCIREMRAFLRDQVMVAGDGRGFTEENVPSDVRLASYSLPTILRCPHVIDLMNDPLALQLAERYLGCRPTISGVRIDWSFAGGTDPEDVQRFHRDLDDWAFLKYFLYLTDVDEDSGPHEFVTGSHRASERLSVAQYSDEEVDRRYGLSNAVKITGPRGTSFFEDTWGIHKGVVPIARPRLIFQVQYSILPIFKYNYRPIRMSLNANFDPYVNRLLSAK